MSEQLFNVTYDRGDGTRSTYCVEPMNYLMACVFAKRFTDKYVGKPYPNGKGHYPFKDVKVVPVSSK